MTTTETTAQAMPTIDDLLDEIDGILNDLLYVRLIAAAKHLHKVDAPLYDAHQLVIDGRDRLLEYQRTQAPRSRERLE